MGQVLGDHIKAELMTLYSGMAMAALAHPSHGLAETAIADRAVALAAATIRALETYSEAEEVEREAAAAQRGNMAGLQSWTPSIVLPLKPNGDPAGPLDGGNSA